MSSISTTLNPDTCLQTQSRFLLDVYRHNNQTDPQTCVSCADSVMTWGPYLYTTVSNSVEKIRLFWWHDRLFHQTLVKKKTCNLWWLAQLHSTQSPGFDSQACCSTSAVIPTVGSIPFVPRHSLFHVLWPSVVFGEELGMWTSVVEPDCCLLSCSPCWTITACPRWPAQRRRWRRR